MRWILLDISLIGNMNINISTCGLLSAVAPHDANLSTRKDFMNDFLDSGSNCFHFLPCHLLQNIFIAIYADELISVKKMLSITYRRTYIVDILEASLDEVERLPKRI